MKNKFLSARIYLVIDFLTAIIINIVLRMILRSEGGLIDWISVLVATVVLMLVNIRAIRRTAEKLEKEGFSAAFKTLFVEEKK